MRLMPTSITTAPSLHHVAGHEPRHADRRDEHVGAPADLGQVARARVAVRHGGVRAPAAAAPIGLPTSFERPTTTASRAPQLDARPREQLHHAGGRARDHRLASLGRAGRR